MKHITFRWPIVVLVTVLTFAAVYGFNQWHQHRVVKEPLKERLEQVEGVQNVEFHGTGDRNKIKYTISLSKVGNLPATYRQLEQLLVSTYNEDAFLLILADNRNFYLESVYEKVQFSLMEGERTGYYTKMKKEVDALLEEEAEIEEYRLWVDQERIYLYMSSGPHYIYEIIPLRAGKTAV